MTTVISVENLSKSYRLGQIGTGTFTYDMQMWWARLRGKPNPLLRIGEKDHGNRAGEEVWALKEVSFNVNQGEVLGIIGRNGAGKSTLLKILSRVTAPTSGEIKVKGRVASLLEVGTGFHPELTGRENVYLNGAIMGMNRRDIDRRFDEIVDFSGVEKYIDTPVKRYSSGMYVRLAFAVAAHLDPEILVVDEVLAVGDAAFQKKCLGKMDEVAHQGRTVLFVSHNMAAVAQLCKSVSLFESGRLVQNGSSSDVISYYLSNTNDLFVPYQNWPDTPKAPGDDKVRLLSCSISQDGSANSIIDINKKTVVSIEFKVLQTVKNLVSGINLYSGFDETCIFAHCDWRENVLTEGVYRKYVEIPEHFLSEGSFHILVQLIFYEPDVKSIVLPRALIFEAVDSDHPNSVRGFYKGKWPGVLRPHFNWSLPEKISKE